MTIFSPPAHPAGGYQIDKSLRFRASGSTYLSRTPTSTGNRQIFTWSGWVKRGTLTTTLGVWGSYSATNSCSYLYFGASDTITFVDVTGSVNINVATTAVFRDPSAWYHIVLEVDTTDAKGTDRVKLWVNGVQQTLTFTTTPAQYANTSVNLSTQPHYLGRITNNVPTTYYLDGYLSEVNFIDGQALDPSYFGQQDTNGVWTPKKYTGTYGTNGFYLDFKDGTSLTTLGYDAAGSNDWTLNNHSLTAGVNYDWMIDTPTNNYCVLNPLQSSATLSWANLQAGSSATGWKPTIASAGVSSGKWYAEFTVSFSDVSNGMHIGVVGEGFPFTSGNYIGQSSNSYAYRSYDGYKYTNGSGSAYGSSYTTFDVIGVALDLDSGSITFYKNNVSQGVAYTGLSGVYFFAVSFEFTVTNAPHGSFNFGQRPFAYTPPTGFKALCTANMSAVSIAKPKMHFETKTHTGTASVTGDTTSVTGLLFAPDLVWVKSRSSAQPNELWDRVRGAGSAYNLSSNATDAEGVGSSYGYIDTFNSDGVTYKAGSSGTTPGAYVNQNTWTYVDWLWKANGAAVSNTAGSITSQVSANQQAGFSIVTYTGTGANATVGHGLGVAPKMVVVKCRAFGDANASWATYHEKANASPASGLVILNGTGVFTTDATCWNSTVPTSSVFSIGTNILVSRNTYGFVAYCFAEIPGYSKFGSYVGNGSTDGPFVYCGFRPKWLLIKKSSATSNWSIIDTARDANNIGDNPLLPNLTNAESTSTSTSGAYLDVTSNGFKLRGTSGDINDNAATYIFAAFAEHPFGGSNVSPSPAR